MQIKSNVAISDSGFLFNPSSGESYTVNPIGIEIIDFLKQGKEKKKLLISFRRNIQPKKIYLKEILMTS